MIDETHPLDPDDNSPGTMEKTETPAVHPYAKKLEKGLQTQRNMLTLLESKIKLLKETSEIKEAEFRASNSPFIHLEITEAKIALINTQGQLEAVKTAVSEKEQYYKGYMEQFVKDEEEVNKRFKHTLDIAKKSTKPHIQKLLSQVLWERIDGDIEAKIALYKQLKKHV